MPLSTQPALLRAIAGWLVVDGLLLLSAGWDAWTGSETDWLDGDATMWWSHADMATYRRWLGETGLQVVAEEFVPEGSSGTQPFLGTAGSPPPMTQSADPRSHPFP